MSVTNTTLTYFSLFWIKSTILNVPQEWRNSGFGCQGQTANRPNDPSRDDVCPPVCSGSSPLSLWGPCWKTTCSWLWRSWNWGFLPLMALFLPWKQAAMAVMWCCHHCSEAVSQRPGEVQCGLSNTVRFKRRATLEQLTSTVVISPKHAVVFVFCFFFSTFCLNSSLGNWI